MPRRLSTKAKLVSFTKRRKNPMAVALGKLGGSKGGLKRAANLSPERRKSIAQQAAQARWTKELSRKRWRLGPHTEKVSHASLSAPFDDERVDGGRLAVRRHRDDRRLDLVNDAATLCVQGP